MGTVFVEGRKVGQIDNIFKVGFQTVFGHKFSQFTCNN